MHDPVRDRRQDGTQGAKICLGRPHKREQTARDRQWRQARVLGVYIRHAEFDDHRVVLAGPRDAFAEQWHRLGVADGQRARWHDNLGEHEVEAWAVNPVTVS